MPTPPTELERDFFLSFLLDTEFMAYKITLNVYEQFNLRLNGKVMELGDKIKRLDMSFSDEVRIFIYKIKDEATPRQPEPQPLQTLTTDKTREELQRIFTGLQKAGFVSPESRLSDWLTAWGIMEDEATNEDGG